MNMHLYMVAPGIEETTKVIKCLREVNAANQDIRVLGKELDKQEILRIINNENLKTSDFIGSLLKGGIIGGSAGLIAGLTMVFILKFPPGELLDPWMTLTLLIIFGILFGAWTSSLIGVSVPNETFRKFEYAIDNDGVVICLNTSKENENKIVQFLKNNFPEIAFLEEEY